MFDNRADESEAFASLPLPESGSRTHYEEVRALFEQHSRSLIRFLAHKLHSQAEAEEVAQEAFLRLLELDRPGNVNVPHAYLFGMASNLAIGRIRHHRVREDNTPVDLIEELLTLPSPERQAISTQELAIVLAVLRELPPKCRRSFELRLFGERSAKEVAEQLGITQRMVNKHLGRALARCRTALGETAAQKTA